MPSIHVIEILNPSSPFFFSFIMNQIQNFEQKIQNDYNFKKNKHEF